MKIPTQQGSKPHKPFICGVCGKEKRLGSWWNDALKTVCNRCLIELER